MRRNTAPARNTSGRALGIAFAASAIVAITARAAADPESPDALSPKDQERLAALIAPPQGFARIFGSFEFGDGLRFNNPYRLATELGSNASSLSRTSSYIDLASGIAYGPTNVAHGLALHLSLGVEGVKQQVLTPSYQLELRPRGGRTLVYGRVGTPIVLSPDGGLGLEAAGGLAYFLTARFAVGGELVGDLFYGAGTRERGVTTYPVLSAQLGVVFEQEFLP